MKIYPPSAEDKLGFDVLRERLLSLVRSTLGEDRLRNMQPSASVTWVRGELVRVFELQQAFRFDDPVPLEHILDVRDVLRRVGPEGAFVGSDDLLAVSYVLATLRRTKSYFISRAAKYPRLADVVLGVTALEGLEEAIRNVVDDSGLVRDDASPELRRLRRLILQRSAQVREVLNAALRHAIGQGFATEDQPTIRNGRMVIPIRAEARRKVAGLVQDVSATGQTVYVEPAASMEMNNELRELEAEERREVERILKEVAGALRESLPEVREGLRILAQFDLLQAKARLANSMDAVVPELTESAALHIRAGRNPVLVLRFGRERQPGEAPREVVPLDLALGGEAATLVVTGPNAGGKTVAMKTVGLLSVMLAYGLPVPVDPLSTLSVFDHLIVDIGDEQSLDEDLSTFSSHVGNLKYMLRHAGARTLVLIDEAGTGTDPAEGGALAQAVLERLTAAGASTIATTHHGTLKAFAHEAAGVENGSMEFDRDTLSPTYRFRQGVPGSSFAFEIARRIGLDPDVLVRARELTGPQKSVLEDLILTLDARNREVQDALSEAEQIRANAGELEARYRSRLERVETERDEIRRRALSDAERLMQEANAAVERTIREIKESQAEREATLKARQGLDAFRDDIEARRDREERRGRSAARKKADARSANRQAPKQSRGAIAVGDQVTLDGGSAVSEVLELSGSTAMIAMGSVRARVALDRLQKVGGPRRRQVTVKMPGAGGSLPVLAARNRIDVRGGRVEEVLPEVTSFVDEAIAAGLNQVEILHGKGTGALRNAIREDLARRQDVASVDDAPWNQGGAGVTYVFLR